MEHRCGLQQEFSPAPMLLQRRTCFASRACRLAVAMDPHSRWINADRAATQQVYEALLDIDSDLAVVPQLALA